MAKLLKINFSIVEGKTNALLYGSKNLMKGVVFEKYVNTIYDLKKQGAPVKDLTMLHGVFSQKISKIKRIINDESIDITGKNIIYLDESNSNLTVIKTCNKSGDIFKYPEARITPMLTAYVRFQITKILIGKHSIIKSFISI